MHDPAAIDRQLADLGPELGPKQVAALLDRLLGRDRSLERLNEMLDALGPGPNVARPMLRDPLGVPGQRPSLRPAPVEPRAKPRSDPPAAARAPNLPGVRGSLPPRIVSPLAPVQGDSLKTATPWPPVASRSPRDTLVDAAVPPPALPKVDEHELDAETAALFGITAPPGAPDPVPAPAPALNATAAAVPAAATPAPVTPAAEAQKSSSRPARNTLQWAAAVEPPPPVEAAAPAVSPAAPEEAPPRQSIRALLDQELDPREFPSSHPPRERTVPPPLRPQSAPAAVEAQDGFEMLIDDSEEDDIMEIDDMELEEIE